MTGAAGRFLVDRLAAGDIVDESRDSVGVCCSEDKLTGWCSFFMGVVPDSLISIKSSSSAIGVAPLATDVSSCRGLDHVPLGSITTCSTSWEVDASILSTYLGCQADKVWKT